MNSHDGFLVQQRPDTKIYFFTFIAGAKTVGNWARADDIRIDRGNVQRTLIESRWKQVRRFYHASPNNVIPTSITIAFDDSLPELSESDLECGNIGYNLKEIPGNMSRLTFPDGVAEHAFIIDGQHRLRGMRDLDFDALVPICLFLKLPTIERAFQFVAINNKSHKVPTDNLRALIANFDSIEGALRDRLVLASVSVPRYATLVDVSNEEVDSPFFKLVDWANNRFEDAKPLVSPSAIENSLRYISRSFAELKDDESEALSVFHSIWRTIFTHFKVTFANIHEYPNITLKATIVAITEMIVDRIKESEDPAFSSGSKAQVDDEMAISTALALVDNIPPEFWIEPWKLKSLDTTAGRTIIKNDIRILKKALRNPTASSSWRSSLNLFREPVGTEPVEFED